MNARRRHAGFTLVEVVVAMAIMVIVSAGVAGLFGIALTTGRESRDRTIAVAVASGKLEQLRSLEWRAELDAAMSLTSRTDLQSDLSLDPPGGGGPGLGESPPGTLDNNVPPYVDFLDSLGRWVGTGAAPPAGALYVRRWAVHRLPADPDRSVALQVLVTTVARERVRPRSSPRAWDGADVLLSTLMTRTVR